MNRFPGPTVTTGNYLRQVVPAGREIKLLVSSSSWARNCKKSIFPTKIHEHLRERNEISRRIQWKPPRAPEIGQKSNFEILGWTGSSNPFATVITFSFKVVSFKSTLDNEGVGGRFLNYLCQVVPGPEIAKNLFFQRKFTKIWENVTKFQGESNGNHPRPQK